MKYCLSGRQPHKMLDKADEIKIELRDFRAIPEYIEKHPDKTLILEMQNELPKDFNWDTIGAYSEMMNGNFYCALSDLGTVGECINRNIKFYYKYTVSTYFELEGLKRLGVSYIVVGVPLIFDLKTVKSYGIPMRAVPNLAYEPYIMHTDGIIGGWIRPEDTDAYAQYIDVFEFYAPQSLDKEAALFHVYAENKTWPGNLNLLIDYLGVDFNNQILYDEDNFAIRRMNCRQKCLQGKFCHYCHDQVRFESVLRKYKDYKDSLN